MTASCAVTKASGTAAAASSSSRSGTAVTCSSCTSDAVGEPASADEPEDPVARSEPRGGRPARDHRPGDLDARDVGR